MIRILALTFLLLFATASMAAPADKHSIDQSVSSLVAQFSDGLAVGYPEYRHVRFGRIFGSDSDDAVAFFNIEGFGGTNYHAEYIAFFAAIPRDKVAGRKTRPYRLVAVTQIGGRGWRSFEPKSAIIKPESVTVTGTKWLEKDAGCCPSEPFTATFRVVDGNIVEIK